MHTKTLSPILCAILLGACGTPGSLDPAPDTGEPDAAVALDAGWRPDAAPPSQDAGGEGDAAPADDAGPVDAGPVDAGEPESWIGLELPPGPPPTDTRGWAWVEPLPQQNTLSGVWAAGPDDAWAVGDGGAIVRRSADGWSWTPSPTYQHLRAVHGSGPDDVWAVGDEGTIVHWDGAAWSSIAGDGPIDFTAVWAISSTDAWAVGEEHEAGWSPIVHWDGRAWTVVDAPANILYDVWGSGPDDVWAVGLRGMTLRWDGVRWGQVPCPATNHLEAVSGASPTDVWAVGEEIVHWDGERWSISEHAPPSAWPEQWTDVLADEDGVWLSRYRRGGGAFGGVLLRGEGEVWTEVWTDQSPKALGSAGAGGLWAVGLGGAIVHHAETGTHALPEPVTYSICGVWSASPNDLWATARDADGDFVVRRWDGSAWSTSLVREGGGGCRISGTGPRDVWVSGSSAPVLHWDGDAWSEVPLPSDDVSVRALWATAPSDAWVVGSDDAIFRWDGSSFSRVEHGLRQLDVHGRAVWAAGPNDVWIVGGRAGTLRHVRLHWDGVEWSSEDAPFFASISGTAGDDVWMAGSCAVEHYDGVSWTRWRISDCESDLPTRVWASGRDDAHASMGGRVVRWDGSAWSSSIGAVVNDWTGSGGDVWGATAGGGLIHFTDP